MFRHAKSAVLSVSIALPALSLGWATAHAQTTLTMSSWVPPTHALTAVMLPNWAAEVEKATKGRVKIQVYPSQTLIKGVDMWRGIRSGIADIGWCVQGYWPEQTPLADVASLPFLPIYNDNRVNGWKAGIQGVRPNQNVRTESWNAAQWRWTE